MRGYAWFWDVGMGFEVACRLRCRGLRVVVVDRDARKVKQLKWVVDFTAILGDFYLSEVLERAEISRAGVVIITVTDFGTSGRALQTIDHLRKKAEDRPRGNSASEFL